MVLFVKLLMHAILINMFCEMNHTKMDGVKVFLRKESGHDNLLSAFFTLEVHLSIF